MAENVLFVYSAVALVSGGRHLLMACRQYANARAGTIITESVCRFLEYWFCWAQPLPGGITGSEINNPLQPWCSLGLSQQSRALMNRLLLFAAMAGPIVLR